jgi:hypothetical protein
VRVHSILVIPKFLLNSKCSYRCDYGLSILYTIYDPKDVVPDPTSILDTILE